jgi:AcrR family transcriptional regulator
VKIPEASAAGPHPPPRRAAILAAALVEFNAKGVAGTSIADIRRRSGASVGSIYHHFGDKEGIAGALQLEGLLDYQDGFLKTLAGAAGARDGIERGVYHNVRWIAGNRELARFMLLGGDAGLTHSTERPLRELNRRFFGTVQRWVAPLVEAGELRELPPEVLTALWIGPGQELARHWLAGRTRVNPTEVAPVLAEAAWKSMSAGDVGAPSGGARPLGREA